MIRTLPFRWLFLIAVAGVIAALLVVVNPLDLLDPDDESEDAQDRERSEIAISTLSATVEVEGTLLVEQQRPGLAAGPGTVTGVATIGSPVEAGSVLFWVDGSPTVALVGEVPAWRAMGVEDVGPDVEQLEANLVELGYDPDGLLSVDDAYTDYTATVVERWQVDLGIEATGSVAAGAVVFVPDEAAVTSVAATTGDAVPAGISSAVLTLSTGGRVLDFEVPASSLAAIGPGTEVSARLPDRSTITAEIDRISPSGDGRWIARASLIEAVDTDGAGGADESGGDGVDLPDGEAVPVSVSWTEVVAADVTTVRANALTRLDNGSYVLEVVDGDRTRFVEVGVGGRVGSTVHIITDLAPGTVVVAP